MKPLQRRPIALDADRPLAALGFWLSSVLVILAVLSSLLSSDAQAVVSIHPDLRRELIARGAYDQVMEQLRQARDRGVFDLPVDESDPTGERAKKITGWHALVILVDFADQPAGGIYGPAEFDDMIFSQGTYPTGSMKDFYLENSYGDFVLTGDVVGWHRMPQLMSYYINNDGIAGTADDHGFGAYPHNARKLYEDAVDAADPFVNYNDYLNGRAQVRGVFIVHSGVGAETTGNASDLWSHQSAGLHPTNDGVDTRTYIFMPELQGAGMSTVGVFCHEFGHVLGLPDLYDTDGSSRGIGRWGLMGSGSWNAGGTRPAHYSAWCKKQLGFLVPTIGASNTTGYALANSVVGPNALELQTPEHAVDEYLLIESRARTGFDDALPGEGLLVWHIDESLGTNRNENCAASGANHPIVRLIQADGLCDLESSNGSGDAGDPFPGSTSNTTLGATTAPSARSYLGGKSGVRLDGIAFDGAQASFDFVLDEVIQARITDNFPDLESALAVAGSGDDIRLPANHVATGNFVAQGGVHISGGWDPSFSAQDPLAPSVLEGTTTLKPVLQAIAGSEPLRLDHLVLRDGRGLTVADPNPQWRGGGVLASHANLEFRNCRFENNAAGLIDNLPAVGGAIAADSCSTLIEDCSFAGNTAKNGGAIWASQGLLTVRNSHFEGSTLMVPLVAETQRGGAIYSTDAAVVLDGVLIENYSGAGEGGGLHASGATTASFLNTTLRNNDAGSSGGGMFLDSIALTARDLTLDGNTAFQGAGGYLQNLLLDWGGGEVKANSADLLSGGLYLDSPSPGSRIASVEFVANSASAAGAALMVSGGALDLEHLLVTGQTGSPTGASVLVAVANVSLFESIVADNAGLGALWSGSSPTGLDANLWWSNAGGDLSGAVPGPGSVLGDPLFADAAGGDFHLGAGSPAIDAGRTTATQDFDGSPADIGPYGGEFDDGDRPGVPQSLNWTETVPWTFELSWTLPALGSVADSVRIEGAPSPASLQWLQTVEASAPNWVHVDGAQNVEFFYRAQLIDARGRAGAWITNARVPVAAPSLPERFHVGAPHPNPFNPSTEIRVALPRAGEVVATIYDAKGRRIRELVHGFQPAGELRLRWEGEDDRARRVASGTYFLHLTSPEGSATRSLVLVK